MKTALLYFFCAALVTASAEAQGVITTIAGNGSVGFAGDGGPATAATLGQPCGVTVDKAGNVYIADGLNQRVRKVDTSGKITTVAGNGLPLMSGDGGPATSAGLSFVTTGAGHCGLAVDGSGNLYISDTGDNRVRKVSPSGIITTFAGRGSLGAPGFSGDGGPATNAELQAPAGLAVDAAGNVYITDTGNGRIRKVDTSGIITTVAGNGNGFTLNDGGPALNAQFYTPTDVAVDNAGNMFIADFGNNRVRKVNTSGVITSIAHGGFGSCVPNVSVPAASADIGYTVGLATDSAGNLYMADRHAACIHKLDTAGVVTNVAGGGANIPGDNGPPTAAGLGTPCAIAVDNSGDIYFADSIEGRVRKVTLGASGTGPLPSFDTSGVVNGASFQAGVSAGSWATIRGSNLAPQTDTWEKAIVNGRLPTTLDGVSVSVGGQPAYVYYISPTQINFIVPESVAAGPQQVTITTPAGTSSAATVQGATFTPAFFEWPGNQAVATRQDFTFAVKPGTFTGTATSAAKPGDIVILWGTGFGPLAPAPPPGAEVPADKTYSTATLPSVTVGGAAAKVYGAALAPGFAGLYQVAIEVPASLANGDWPVVASVGGVQSAAGVVLSVQK